MKSLPYIIHAIFLSMATLGLPIGILLEYLFDFQGQIGTLGLMIAGIGFLSAVVFSSILDQMVN